MKCDIHQRSLQAVQRQSGGGEVLVEHRARGLQDVISNGLSPPPARYSRLRRVECHVGSQSRRDPRHPGCPHFTHRPAEAERCSFRSVESAQLWRQGVLTLPVPATLRGASAPFTHTLDYRHTTYTTTQITHLTYSNYIHATHTHTVSHTHTTHTLYYRHITHTATQITLLTYTNYIHATHMHTVSNTYHTHTHPQIIHNTQTYTPPHTFTHLCGFAGTVIVPSPPQAGCEHV